MIAISNEDFRIVRTLLKEIQRIEGCDTHTKNTKRTAILLLRKFDRKNKNEINQ